LRSKFRIWILRGSILFVASIISFLFIEITLRAIGRYEAAASSRMSSHSRLLWTSKPNHSWQAHHPDTGTPHQVAYNERGLRQSRPKADHWDNSLNIAFFGDSMTENYYLAQPHVFTEPLHYLLNLDKPTNVLNFGLSGYGTGQSYLKYLEFEERDKLDVVFYVLTANDLRNIYENELFDLDADGKLHLRKPPKPSVLISLVSRLHTTYLLLDVFYKLDLRSSKELDVSTLARKQAVEKRRAEKAQRRMVKTFLRGSSDAVVERSAKIMAAIVSEWRLAVEQDGGQFVLVLLPTGRETPFRDLFPETTILDLREHFIVEIPNYSYKEHLRLKNDGHWNERGNFWTAIFVYRFLTGNLENPLLDDVVKERLAIYYSAHESWFPYLDLTHPTTLDQDDREELRGLYGTPPPQR
jgi:hypothetical protein